MSRSVKYSMSLQLQLLQLPLLMCLAGLLQSDFCRGAHLVHIQEGPLYRVKGYPMSISCNVTGYTGQEDQGFAFSVYKPDYPQTENRIISTFDQNYAYAAFTQRVRNKNIITERLSKTSVLLHFTSLLAEDAGEYECYTPNLFSTYEGTYNAKTTLNVIEDTLKASNFGLPSLSIFEGDSFQLNCEVSSQTMQHTHLSVGWYLRTSSETLSIITLDRDLTVRTGAHFRDQYNSGLISMDKIEDTTYRLKMSQVQQSASGAIYCQAEEWIQEPDRSWIRIAHKNTSSTNVEIKVVEVTEEGSFNTDIKITSEHLQEGEKVEIICSVHAQDLPGHFFSITWLKDNMQVAQFGPLGVLTVANKYKGRANEGELRAVKINDNTCALTIHPVRTEDQGQYQCKATQKKRTDTGNFTIEQTKLSREQGVHITAKESGLVVVMKKEQLSVTEGEILKLTCSVSGASGPLSVSWQHKKTSGSPFRDVISLSREGVMVEGMQYQDRSVRTFRSTAANITLEINDAVLSDSGEYKCTVSEWSMESSGSMKEVNSKSQQASVSVKSIDSLLTVVLRSRETNVVENSVIHMYCTVKGPQVPLDVHWKFQQISSDNKKDIICMLRSGAISCGKEQNDYRVEAQVTESNTVFTLSLLKAKKSQQGRYMCQITAYQENIQKTQKHSNELEVRVHSPASKLQLSVTPRAQLDAQIDSNRKIDCFIKGTVSDSSRFAVTWMSGTQTLIRMDENGVVTLGPAVSQDMEQRINMRMTERHTFQLTIQQVRPSDSGQYNCSVEEWIQDPDCNYYSLEKRSVATELVVNDIASDFHVDKTETQLVVTEGESVDLNCSLNSIGLDSTFLYSVIWSVERQDRQATTVNLLTYSHDGRLQFHEDDSRLQHRLYFSRPKVSTLHLSILNSIVSDSGRYRCRVDQYQLDCEGKLELKASKNSGFTNVSVHYIENKLKVQKSSHNVNITDHHVGFEVECNIISRSSNKSHFEVTWYKTQEDGQTSTIFTARPNGTLHSKTSNRELLYHHPSETQYILTMHDVKTSDDGQYHCQVKECLQTAENWRLVAEDKSGELSVHVHVEAARQHKQDSSSLILGSLIPIICIMLVVILLLILTLKKTKSASKKQKDSLWTENHPLKTVSGEEGSG